MKVKAKPINEDITKTGQDWVNRAHQVLTKNYATFPVVVAKGNGATVFDVDGKAYIDFVAGIAVNAVGHADPDLVKALSAQANEMLHCSNLYYNPKQIELAELLVANSVFDKAFFCNSGTEAMEAAIKLSRKLSKTKRGEHCTEVISLTNSFHGRTLGALSATGQEKYHHGFEPLLSGFKTTKANDIEALRQAISQNTSALIVEPIQGEGGVNPISVEYLKAARELCTAHEITLVFDEIQCGMGRMGSLFAYQSFGVQPDLVALAKGLGGGFPIGAILAVDSVAEAFQPGDHGSTFGGNPLACTAALVVVKKLLEPGFLKHVQEVSKTLLDGLNHLKSRHSCIVEVRGRGLMLGVELNCPNREVIQESMNRGLLLIGAGPNVLRFVPPLIISEVEIERGVGILDQVLTDCAQGAK